MSQPTPTILAKFNKTEALVDVLSMYGIDMLNNLDINLDKPTVTGILGGVALWQYWGKYYQEKSIQKITLATIANDPGKAENVAEHDIEILLGLKGGLYTLSIYLTSLLMKGKSDKMNLVDSVMVAYGGALASSVVRSNMVNST